MSKNIDIEDGRPVDFDDDAAAGRLQSERYGDSSEGGISVLTVVGIICLVVVSILIGCKCFGAAPAKKPKNSKSRAAEVEAPEEKGGEEGSDSDDGEPGWLAQKFAGLKEKYPIIDTIQSSAYYPFLKGAAVVAAVYQLVYYGWFNANAAMDRKAGSMNTVSATWYNPVSWVTGAFHWVGGKTADRFSANLSGDPRKHAAVTYNMVGGSEIGHALFDGKLESTYGHTLKNRGDFQEAWNNSWTGSLMGASENYEQNWLKQCIASAVSFFSGYKLIEYCYPEIAPKVYLYAAGGATFMMGIASAQMSAWTMLLGTGLMASGYMAAPITSMVAKGTRYVHDKTGKHQFVEDYCVITDKREATAKKFIEDHKEKVDYAGNSIKDLSPKLGSHLSFYDPVKGEWENPDGGDDGGDDDKDGSGDDDKDD